MVHGVVVQDRTYVGKSVLIEKILSKDSFSIGNKKSIAFDSLSKYSTSASARADLHSEHQ